MHMIGKLSKDWKADWPKHLSELVHTYNSTRSATTRYSPNYLMFGCQLCLPIDFYFPMIRGKEKHQHVDHYIAEFCEWLWEAFQEVQMQSTSEAERQKHYYDRKANAISLEPGDLVLAKAETYKGKSKVKDWWEEEPYEVEYQGAEDVPSYLVKNGRQDAHESFTETDFFSSLPQRGPPLYGCLDWVGKLCHYHPGGANSEREWDWESATKCELSAAGPTPFRWDSSRLGKQEALCIPLDVFWSLLVGSRVKSSM